MGLLRLILALAVLVGHSKALTFYGFRLISGDYAVAVFFMLSGFYMALILDGPYRAPGAYRQFFANRMLRLYPMYLAVLASTVPIAWIAASTGAIPDGTPNVVAARMFTLSPIFGGLGAVLDLLVQITLVGMDYTAAFVMNPTGITPIWRFAADPALQQQYVPMGWFLLVPQAWSLGLEITFYALAPWLTRQRTTLLVAMGLVSVALLLTINATWLGNLQFFRFRFFPTQVWTFLAGILMYRGYGKLPNRYRSDRRLRLAPIAMCAAVLAYPYIPPIPGVPDARIWMVQGAVALLFPLSFAAFDENAGLLSARLRSIDRWLGDLSYPVYISHILAMYITLLLVRRVEGPFLAVAIAITVAISVGLLRWVQGPIETIRARNRTRAITGTSRAERRRVARTTR